MLEEKCALLGYYAASSGNSLPTFWDNLSVPSSRDKNPRSKSSMTHIIVSEEFAGYFHINMGKWYLIFNHPML